MDGRGLTEPGQGRGPAGRTSSDPMTPARPARRDRRPDDREETRPAEQVGDAELFDVDDAGAGVVARPAERPVGPSGPALGRDG